MSLTTECMTPADLAAVCGNSNGNGNNDGMFGGNGAWWIIILLLFGFGNRGGGFGGQNGGNGGGYAQPIIIDSGRSGGCGCDCCATPADVRAAVDQQTLISKLDQQTYGLADSTYALNNTINSNFRTLDNALCTLGYQNQAGINSISAQLAQCCCDTRAAIQDNTTSGVMNTNALSRQISDCCCDMEKMNMQSRYDAQAMNCNTLQAIDKLGDRIIDFMSNEKMQTLRDENQSLRLAASQQAQNAFITANQQAQTAELIRRLGADCPQPAYLVNGPTPINFPTNCCGQVQFSNNNCGCGCGNF